MSRKTLLGYAAAALIALTSAAPGLALSATHKTTTHKTATHRASSHGKSAKHSKSRGVRSAKSSNSAKCRHGRHCSSSRRVSHASYGASGRVVEAEGSAKTYTVKKSQGLDAVARETDLSKEELAKLNDLKSPYRLKVGQKLKLGTSGGHGKAYVVAKGDTLTAVAERFHVSTRELVSLNKLGKSTALKPGRKLALPEAFRDSGEIVARSLPHAADFRQTQIEPGQNATLPPVDLPSQTVAPPINAAQVTEAGAGKFIWPLAGRVVQPFGQGASVDKSDDGINIAAPVGTPVKASAPGVVIFAGKQIAAFGNYVLLQHDGGFLTAYGNMDRLNVKIGQKVDQGEEIGQSGQTGQAAQPELHFEVLYAAHKEDKSAPVDPQAVLPKL
jgi:murein DD-endopeptidase MepM/ murein hydrolase activator NlpD